MSSNSVTSVMTLARFQRVELLVGDVDSSVESADGEEGRMGAERKWKPLGVGKWSLMGDSQAST
jgi:hypothetical protein